MINTRIFPGNNPTTKEGFKRWLDEVAKHATDEDFDPVLLPKYTANGYVNEDGTPYQEFEYSKYIPGFSTLSAIGDRRYSLGHMVSATFQKYLPIINTYTEIAQAGGCQVINDYICDSDGNPIKRVSSNCPDGNLNIDPNEVVSFVLNSYNEKKNEDILAFVNYIKTNFVNSGYTVALNTIKDFPYFFFVKVTKNSDVKYFRYYYDDKDRISSYFAIPITEIVLSKNTNDSRLIDATKAPIPVYNSNLTV